MQKVANIASTTDFCFEATFTVCTIAGMSPLRRTINSASASDYAKTSTTDAATTRLAGKRSHSLPKRRFALLVSGWSGTCTECFKGNGRPTRHAMDDGNEVTTAPLHDLCAADRASKARRARRMRAERGPCAAVRAGRSGPQGGRDGSRPLAAAPGMARRQARPVLTDFSSMDGRKNAAPGWPSLW